MTEVWTRTEASLPLEWHLDSLRCTSVGSITTLTSDRWLAVAVGPDGERLEGDGGSPEQALTNLAAKLRERRGSISGEEGTRRILPRPND
jgi:hypothetical protein